MVAYNKLTSYVKALCKTMDRHFFLVIYEIGAKLVRQYPTEREERVVHLSFDDNVDAT
jgi:hypothetical protein